MWRERNALPYDMPFQDRNNKKFKKCIDMVNFGCYYITTNANRCSHNEKVVGKGRNEDDEEEE